MVFHLLFCLPFCLAFAANGEDTMTPYKGKHGPNHGFRQVRSIQSLHWGSNISEVHQSSSDETQALTTTHVFTDKNAKTSALIFGHLITIGLPQRTFSVLEPGLPGGCNPSWPIRATVEDTSHPAGCLAAMNAGFFRVLSGHCLGSVVSEGTVIQTSNDTPNAAFGIRKDGFVVTGYIRDSELHEFTQLVSGVVWLVRRGVNYVEESANVESPDNEGTGTMRRFIDVVSARTAIGHDAAGRVVFAQIDGQTDSRGVDLHTFANFLISHGVVNAINLDGGGSATTAVNGTLVSYPSDRCPERGGYRCARKVSTVICAHRPQCDPPDCHGRGKCVLGRCQCSPPWSGDACLNFTCSDNHCSNKGVCKNNPAECECFVAGYTGRQCEETCTEGLYGIGCNLTCPCVHYVHCSPHSGSCTCKAGWSGPHCDVLCPSGWHGVNCLEICPDCSLHGTCSPIDGKCNCSEGWRGQDCNEVESAPTLLHEEVAKGVSKVSVALAVVLGVSMFVNFIFVCSTYCKDKRKKRQTLDFDFRMQ